MRHQRYNGRIVRDRKSMGGKSVVKGTRIPVDLVLAKLAANPDLNELFADYPRLTIDDVRACLDCARDAVQWRDHVRQALREGVGSLQGVNREELQRDFQEQREQDSRGRPA